MIQSCEVFTTFVESYQLQISDDMGEVLGRWWDIDDDKLDMRIGTREGRYLMTDDGDREVLACLSFDGRECPLEECEHLWHRSHSRWMTEAGNKGKHTC